MASHLRWVLGFALIGCTMDNPAFGRVDIGDGESGDGDPDASSMGESSESATTVSSNGDGDPSTTNGDGDGDSSTTNGDGDGDSSTTDGDGDGDTSTTDDGCTLTSDCPTCHACDPNGVCVPDVGTPCAGAVIHCEEFLWGAEEGTCFRLSNDVVGSTCDENGQCKAAGPDACPNVQGVPHFSCDPGCVEFAEACAPYAPAANVELDQMCVAFGPGPECKPSCINEQFSSSVFDQSCLQGQCSVMGVVMICDPYKCDDEGAFCYQQCGSDLQCVNPNDCVMGSCL